LVLAQVVLLNLRNSYNELQLQHIATHCIALERTATLYITLQHNANVPAQRLLVLTQVVLLDLEIVDAFAQPLQPRRRKHDRVRQVRRHFALKHTPDLVHLQGDNHLEGI